MDSPGDSQTSSVIIVNGQDETVGHKQRGSITPQDIYRVSSLWLTNSRGEILLAKRSKHKRHDPGKWGPAVAGTNDEGETYESNIIKETSEEIGLKNIHPTKGPKGRAYTPHAYFCQIFTLTIDKPAEEFVIQEDEVEQVRWFSLAELLRGLREHPGQYLDGLNTTLELLYR